MHPRVHYQVELYMSFRQRVLNAPHPASQETLRREAALPVLQQISPSPECDLRKPRYRVDDEEYQLAYAAQPGRSLQVGRRELRKLLDASALDEVRV